MALERNKKVLATLTSHGTQVSWANLDGGTGWKRIKSGHPSGVTNLTVLLNCAQANGRDGPRRHRQRRADHGRLHDLKGVAPMSSQPEVAITIMTGGQQGPAETGPTPMPLDQLLSAVGGDADAGSAAMPSDAIAFGGAAAAPIDEPIPLELDELAALAAPRRRSPAKKTTSKKAPAKRARR